MRRSCILLLAISFAATLPAQPWPNEPSEGPSVTDPSVPLTYVGGDGSVSLGVNAEGETEGQLLGVFARNDARAVVGQLWWDRAGAGGLQTDFNWLWGMDPVQARLHPEQATVARLSFAFDQNAAHDRKATLGFGIERREFSLEGYLARGFSGGRAAGSAAQERHSYAARTRRAAQDPQHRDDSAQGAGERQADPLGQGAAQQRGAAPDRGA